MRIVAISHIRCSELDKTDYWVIPDSMVTEEAITDAIDKVHTDYLEAVDKLAATYKPEFVSPNVTQYNNDSLTVGEIKAAMADYERAYKEYDTISHDFSTYLKKLGFIPLCDYEGYELVSYEVNWGHRHGSKIEY